MSKAPTDEHVLQAACRGDRNAFPCLVERFADELFGYLRRRADDDAAPDLLQDTFLRIHKAADRYQPRSSVRTYVYTVARNVVLNYHRDHQTMEAMSREAAASAVSEDPAPEVPLESEEQGRRIRRGVERLSDPLREVVILRHFQGLSFREVAEILQIPEGTAMRRMADALVRLREELQDIP